MGLIDVVKKAQCLGPLDAQAAGLCGLKATWLISEEVSSTEVGDGELVSYRGVPSGSDFIKVREEQEERLVSELQSKADDSITLTFLEGLLRSYFEQVTNPNPNSNPDPNPNLSSPNPSPGNPRRVAQTAFIKILKKASPLLGQRLLSATLRALLVSRNWDGVRTVLDSHALNGNTHLTLVPTLIEHDQAALLCLWIRNVCDPRFSDLLVVLKYFLKSTLRAGKSLAGVRNQWRQTALATIGRISEVGLAKEKNEEDKGIGSEVEHADGSGHTKKKTLKEDVISKALLLAAAVDHFQPFELCLHYLVASGHDEAVLASILSELDNGEALKLLRYLRKWMEKYSRQGSLITLQSKRKDLWVPSLGDVVQWASVLIDAHLMSLVLCSDFHSEIQSVQLLIRGLVNVGHKLAPLVGVTEHLRTSGLLPMLTSSHTEDDHVIEYLEI